MAYSDPPLATAGTVAPATLWNTYIKDNFDFLFPTDGSWTTWSPSYANLTVGNGTVVARYFQVGKLVVARWTITFGSTSTMGTGPTVSMPVTAASTGYVLADHSLGPCSILDSGTARFEGQVYYNSTTTVLLTVSTASGTNLTQGQITSTVPMTWTTSDKVSFLATYEAA